VVRGAFHPAWVREQCSMLQQRSTAAFLGVWRAAVPAGSRGMQAIKGTSRKTFDRLRATPWQILARRHWKLLLGIVGAFLLIVVWKVPQWQAAGWQGLLEPKDLAKLQNDARTTLVQALGGAVLLIGLYFTLRNLQLTQDRQITEQYTRAVEQLGSDRLAVRLGAIYALERIARDSERDHWPIMEILTAYVRENVPWKEEEQPLQEERSRSETQPIQINQSPPKLAADIQAILTVLGRRTRTYGKGEDHPLNLTYTDLCGAHLWKAHLEGAFLSKSCLDRAILAGAHLERASLREAHLEGAALDHADLTGANLDGAYLTGVSIYRTCLAGASLRGITAEGFLQITPEQLSTLPRGGFYKATLDPQLQHYIQQHYPHLFEMFSYITVEDA
jgi:Pentapeptide repeats (8 copies)